jgi:DNA-binding beta-propeller fold protein YncE
MAGTGQANAAPTRGAATAFIAPHWIQTIGHAGDAFVYPWAMATETIGAYAGDIIVGDYNNYNLKVFTPATSTTPGQLVATISQKGSALGSMGQPYGIAIDPIDGSIYVADQNNHRVDKFIYNAQGTSMVSAPYAISPPHASYAPYVAVDSHQHVFIVESTILSSAAGTNEIFEYDSAGNAITTYVGTDGTNCGSSTVAPQFGNIRGIDVDSSDNLYVLDTTSRCIQVFNTENGAPFSSWVFEGSFGDSTHLSADTRNMTVDRQTGMVYVADAAKNVVDVFTTCSGTIGACPSNGGTGGAFQGTIGSPGVNEGSIGGERGVAVGLDSTVYASDYTYWRVNAYTPLFSATPNKFLLQIPDPPVPPPAGGFNNPTAVAVSTYPATAGDIYVSDTFNQRIQQFDTSGNWLYMWGNRLSQLNAPYAFDYPRGVAVDPVNGNVWVNDTRSGYIKEYDGNGKFIHFYGGPGVFNYAVGIFVANGEVLVPDSNNDRLQVLSTSNGAEVAPFPVPCGTGRGYGNGGGCTGVTVDAAGNIYAAAPELNEILVFNSAGTQIYTITGGGLKGPYDAAVSGTTLVVTNSSSSQVSEFDISTPTAPTFLGTWGKQGTATGALNSPRGISVDASGNIYIVDYGNSRVEEFAP